MLFLPKRGDAGRVPRRSSSPPDPAARGAGPPPRDDVRGGASAGRPGADGGGRCARSGAWAAAASQGLARRPRAPGRGLRRRSPLPGEAGRGELPAGSGGGGEDASEAAAERALHRAGQLPVLAGAGAPRHPPLHLRADPRVPQGQPVHHRRLPGLPALQAVYQKVQSGRPPRAGSPSSPLPAFVGSSRCCPCSSGRFLSIFLPPLLPVPFPPLPRAYWIHRVITIVTRTPITDRRFAVDKGLLHRLSLWVLTVGLTPRTMVEPSLPLCISQPCGKSDVWGQVNACIAGSKFTLRGTPASFIQQVLWSPCEGTGTSPGGAENSRRGPCSRELLKSSPGDTH